VKHLTELHRGTVSAESLGEGQGATFTVTLPLVVASKLLPATTQASGHLWRGGVRLDGLRILAVDDDPDALELASTILGGAGASMKLCRSAADALAAFEDWRPDVLVSDIDMPGEDGYSLIQKVRALDQARGTRTPAIALTAYGRTEDRVQTLSSGYNMHVPKPVDPGEFTSIIAGVARVLHPPNRSIEPPTLENNGS
jgi:CheY-like chemotaxis protein